MRRRIGWWLRPDSTSVVLRHVRPDTVVPNDPRWLG